MIDHHRPNGSAESPLSVEFLTRLGRVTGHPYDLERVRRVLVEIHGRAEGDPIAHLALAANELDLRVTPMRLPFSEAVWQARKDLPVVLWNEREGRFLIISYASAFQLKLANYDGGDSGGESLSRARLARRLGLKNVHETVEVGLVHPQRAAERASVQAKVLEDERATRYAVLSHRKKFKEQQKAHEHGHGHAHMHPLRRFLQILRPERRDILTLLVFAVFSGILYLAVPFAVDAVVSNLAFGGQAKPFVQALLIIGKILAVCLLLQALIIGFQFFIAEVIQRRIFVRTAADLAFRLPRVRAQALDGAHGPELVNRFLDVVTVQKNTAFFLLEGINLVAATVIGMALLALYHPLLLGFVGLLIVLIVAVTWILGRGAMNTAIEESRSKYDLVGWFEEVAAYPVMFKGPGGYEMAYQRTNLLATQYLNARVKHFGVVIRQVSGLLALSVIAAVALLMLGAWLVMSQQITLGQLVASEIIMSGIVASLVKFGKKLEAWYDTMAATDKLGHIFDLETEREDGETPATENGSHGMRVTAENLAFAYPEGPTLFENRNFDLAPGTRVALCGVQGSGVSSLLDLLFAVRQPTQGHISLDGLDLRNWQLDRLRESVELLRRDEIVDGTVADNLRLGRPDIGMDEVRDALDRVGLLDDVLNHPDGLNLRLKVGGGPLSTSQRVRLLCARAIVQQPRLLLIDELLDGLDETTFRELSKAMLANDEPWTVIVATRLKDVAALCDEVIELSPALQESRRISQDMALSS